MLAVTQASICNWARAGLIPGALRVGKNRWRLPVDAIAALERPAGPAGQRLHNSVSADADPVDDAAQVGPEATSGAAGYPRVAAEVGVPRNAARGVPLMTGA